MYCSYFLQMQIVWLPEIQATFHHSSLGHQLYSFFSHGSRITPSRLLKPIIVCSLHFRDSRPPFRRNFIQLHYIHLWISYKSIGKFPCQTPSGLEKAAKCCQFDRVWQHMSKAIASNRIYYFIEKLDMLKFSLIEIAHYKQSFLNGDVKWMVLKVQEEKVSAVM